MASSSSGKSLASLVEAFRPETAERLAWNSGAVLPPNALQPAHIRGRLLPHHHHPAVPEGLRRSAVLVGIRQGQVLLTQRPRALRQHGGQIAFPGGASEPSDPSDWHTALRESAEEVGLLAHQASPLGMLPIHVTRTGFAVVPMVADLHPEAAPSTLRPDPTEVDEVFELPLSELLDPSCISLHTVRLESESPEFHVIQCSGRIVWGATAAILRSLYLALAE